MKRKKIGELVKYRDNLQMIINETNEVLLYNGA